MKDLKDINYDRILEMAKDRMKNAGQFTFVFSGNFDEQTIRPLIEQYIASLPATGEAAEDYADIDIMAKGEVVNQFKVKTGLLRLLLSRFGIVICHAPWRMPLRLMLWDRYSP